MSVYVVGTKGMANKTSSKQHRALVAMLLNPAAESTPTCLSLRNYLFLNCIALQLTAKLPEWRLSFICSYNAEVVIGILWCVHKMPR